MTRLATIDELLDRLDFEIRYPKYRISFRHFLLESYRPNARNGVAHKQYSRSRVYIIDGVPHVQHHGKMERIRASYADANDFTGEPYAKPIIYDIRLDSDYLDNR